MHLLDKSIFNSAKLWHTLVVLSFIIILATGYIPQIARSTRPDAVGRDNMWLHLSFAEDFRVYLSAITLGQHGYSLFRNPFTTENFRPLPYYLYYIAFGWITGPIHLWPPYVYHISKFIAVMVFVGSIYYLARVILKKPRFAGLATIIALVTTTLPDWFYNQHIAASFKPWWEDLSATLRLDTRPHHVLSEGLMTLSIAFFIRAGQTNRWKFLTAACLTGILTVLMVPHAVIPFLLIVSLTCGIQSIKLLGKHTSIGTLASAWLPMIVCIPALSTIWILQQYAVFDPVWLSYRDWEVNFWNRDPLFWYHLYVTYIPLIIPSAVTWIWSLRHKRTDFLLLAGWTFFPLLLYPFTDLIHFGKGRLALCSIEIPLAISAVFAMFAILPKYIPRIILMFITIAFILYSITMIGIQGKNMWNKTMREYTWYSLIYVPNEYVEALNEVGKVVPENSHVLTGDVLGNLLPGFQPIINYIGYATQTYKWDEKLALAGQFYSGNMTDEEARRFLTLNGISYVIDDQETKWWETKPMTYPFLQPIWHNSLVKLYKVE